MGLWCKFLPGSWLYVASSRLKVDLIFLWRHWCQWRSKNQSWDTWFRQYYCTQWWLCGWPWSDLCGGSLQPLSSSVLVTLRRYLCQYWDRLVGNELNWVRDVYRGCQCGVTRWRLSMLLLWILRWPGLADLNHIDLNRDLNQMVFFFFFFFFFNHWFKSTFYEFLKKIETVL